MKHDNYSFVEDITSEEKIYIDKQVRKAKKEVIRQRKLKGSVVGSSWFSIPVYCEIHKVEGDRVYVEDELNNKYWINLEKFISLHDYRG